MEGNDNVVVQKNLRKKMIAVIIWAFVILAVLFAVTYAIDLYNNNKKVVEEEPIDYDFYPVDFGENIYEDEEYVELIKYGFISYTDSALTLGIEREDAVDFGKDVVFMMEYLYSIIEGDSEKYNAYFSDAYYKRHDRKDAFTMQKLYDVEITKESVTTVTDKDVTYTQYRYSLVYKIFENNGSFRNDIGDGAKKQYITFTDRDGELLIDDISIAKIIVQKAK